MLEKLLAEVVAKWVNHQFGHMVVHLIEDDLHNHGIPVLQFFLQKPTSVLVLAEGVDVSDHLLDASVLA